MRNSSPQKQKIIVIGNPETGIDGILNGLIGQDSFKSDQVTQEENDRAGNSYVKMIGPIGNVQLQKLTEFTRELAESDNLLKIFFVLNFKTQDEPDPTHLETIRLVLSTMNLQMDTFSIIISQGLKKQDSYHKQKKKIDEKLPTTTKFMMALGENSELLNSFINGAPLAKINKPKTSKIVMIGNPETGIDSILNGLLGKANFKPDQVTQEENDGADNSYVKMTGPIGSVQLNKLTEFISQALESEIVLKIFFVLTFNTQEEPDQIDLETINLVLSVKDFQTDAFSIIISRGLNAKDVPSKQKKKIDKKLPATTKSMFVLGSNLKLLNSFINQAPLAKLNKLKTSKIVMVGKNEVGTDILNGLCGVERFEINSTSQEEVTASGDTYIKMSGQFGSGQIDNLTRLAEESLDGKELKIFFIITFSNGALDPKDISLIRFLLYSTKLITVNAFSIIINNVPRQFDETNVRKQINENLPTTTQSIHMIPQDKKEPFFPRLDPGLRLFIQHAPCVQKNGAQSCRFPDNKKALLSLMKATECNTPEKWKTLIEANLNVNELNNPRKLDQIILLAWYAIIAKKNNQGTNFWGVAQKWVSDKLPPATFDDNITDAQRTKFKEYIDGIMVEKNIPAKTDVKLDTVAELEHNNDEDFLKNLIRLCKGKFLKEFSGEISDLYYELPNGRAEYGVGPVKGFDRAFEKAKEYESEKNEKLGANYIYDLLRCKFTLVASNDKELEDQKENVSKILESLEKFKILRVKNNFKDPVVKTILINIQYKKVIAEVQIMFNKVSNTLFSDHHQIYDYKRCQTFDQFLNVIKTRPQVQAYIDHVLKNGGMICNHENKKKWNGESECKKLPNYLALIKEFSDWSAPVELEKGIHTWKDGRKYLGSLKNGKREGNGTFWDYNGDRYEGDWKEDRKEGKNCIFWYSNGDRYQGDWVNDLMDGEGTYEWKDGRRYTGSWKKGRREGKGTFLSLNGDTYVGNWKNNLMDGEGSFTWKDGRKYTGSWKDGRRHGKGTYSSSNGEIYDGEWNEGLRSGKGTFSSRSGEKYDGKWKDNLPDGSGIFTWNDGRKYQGPFKAGKIYTKAFYEFWVKGGTFYSVGGAKSKTKWEISLSFEAGEK